jgi:hypothetical protein
LVQKSLIATEKCKKEFSVTRDHLGIEVEELSNKFTKSIMLVSKEIDDLKDPFHDFIQNIEK